MKKEKIPIKKMPYIDYECKVGERVWWENLTRQRFEGVIIEWKEDSIAVVQLDDNSLMEVQC